MKLVKMSLAAAMLMGASAFAVDNIKISGDAKVYYSTNDADGANYDATTSDTKGSLFDKDSSAADAAVHLNVTADLTDGISAGVGYTAISTLGLENNFVSNVWGGSHGATLGEGNTYANNTVTNSVGIYGAKVDNANWFNEAWVAATLGKTTAKIGRMELDTPLAFTETWSIERNSFEAAVLLNQDLPDTTLVAAWVGNGNGTEAFGDAGMEHSPILDVAGTGISLAYAPVVNMNGNFSTYGTDGAYAFGIVNNSVKPLTLQAWYYDVTKMAQAYWLQADLAMDNGILAGAQFCNVDAGDLNSALEANSVYALMLGFAMKDVATIKASYSSVDDKAGVGAGWNTATSTGASKLYTEAWWNYGFVTLPDTQSFNITVTGTVAGFDLGAYYTSADNGTVNAVDMNEFDITVGKSFGPLDATLAYINTDCDALNDGAFNTVQAYLTLNF